MAIEKDDADIAALLARIGKRSDPPSDLRNRVLQASHVELQRTLRRRRSRVGALAAIAATLLVVVSITFYSRMPDGGPAIGWVAEASGDASLMSGAVRQGAEVSTSRGYLRIMLYSGISVRLDEGTHVEFGADDTLNLKVGRLYVDSAGAPTILVETPRGSITDIGTQFEVVVDVDRLAVTVREGSVIYSNGGTETALHANSGWGDLLVASSAGLRQSTRATTDQEWDWTLSTSTGLGRRNTVAAIVNWIARERGFEVEWDSESTQVAASSISKATIVTPESLREPRIDVLELLSTTSFDYRIDGHILRISSSDPS